MPSWGGIVMPCVVFRDSLYICKSWEATPTPPHCCSSSLIWTNVGKHEIVLRWCRFNAIMIWHCNTILYLGIHCLFVNLERQPLLPPTTALAFLPHLIRCRKVQSYAWKVQVQCHYDMELQYFVLRDSLSICYFGRQPLLLPTAHCNFLLLRGMLKV